MAAILTAAALTALAAVFAVVQYTNEINGRRHGLWYLPIFETAQHWSLKMFTVTPARTEEIE